MAGLLERLGGPEQLSGLDASFLYTESARTPMHIGAVAIYDPSTAPGGKIRHKDIINFVEERLHLAKTFRQKIANVPLGVDHPYWVDDSQFDIEYHIRHIGLPYPGDWRQLCILAARIHARPMDLSKPLWEFTIVEGLDNVEGVPKGAYAIISKVHHAAIDGVSGVDITHAVHTLNPDDKAPPPEKPWVPAREPSRVELLTRAQFNNAVQPLRALDVMRRTAPGALKMLTGLGRGELKTGSLRVPRTRFNKTVTPHRVFEGRSFSLEDIKQIRKRLPGSTVNDVILTICGGAMRMYLDSKNELPKDSMIAMAPVSVRSDGEKGSLGNQVSAMMVELGTHIDDPLARLHYVHESAMNSKAMTKALGAREMSEASKLAPAMITGVSARLYTRLGLANRISPMFNTVITNVPGPQVPLYCAGARLVTQFGLGPLYDGMGIIHPVYSYCGNITVSFNSCRDMMPDPEFYADCLQASFDELLDAAVGPKPKAPRPKKTEAKAEAAPAAKAAPAKKPAAKAAAPKKKAAPAKKAAPKGFQTLKAPVGAPDDLKLIKGIGPGIEKKLNDMGVYHFYQIAALKAADIKKIEDELAFPGRIKRDDWVAQAKNLAKDAGKN